MLVHNAESDTIWRPDSAGHLACRYIARGSATIPLLSVRADGYGGAVDSVSVPAPASPVKLNYVIFGVVGLYYKTIV